MKISIQTQERDLCLKIPDGLLLNKMTALLVSGTTKQYARGIAPASVERLFQEIRRVKKNRGTSVLVEVETPEGKQIQIQL